VTVIEIERGRLGLGLSIIGGTDTHIPSILVHDIFENGAAYKDNRLCVGDQILSCNDYDLKSLKHEEALNILRRQSTDFIKLTVYRRLNTFAHDGSLDDDDKYDVINVDLNKKFGKGLGLSIVGRRNGNGVYVSHLIEGGCADKDGRLMVGDVLLEVNGLNIRSSPYNSVAYLLKTLPAQSKVQLKVGRFRSLNLHLAEVRPPRSNSTSCRHYHDSQSLSS
jgi:C-terminal processing protease CtpA/Prc